MTCFYRMRITDSDTCYARCCFHHPFVYTQSRNETILEHDDSKLRAANSRRFINDNVIASNIFEVSWDHDFYTASDDNIDGGESHRPEVPVTAAVADAAAADAAADAALKAPAVPMTADESSGELPGGDGYLAEAGVQYSRHVSRVRPPARSAGRSGAQSDRCHSAQ